MGTMPRQKPGRSKQDYSTPREFITTIKNRFGISEFLWDFAADDFNTVSPVGFWSKEDDSLSKVPQHWARKIQLGWGWLNPPFAHIEPWAIKCMEAGQLGAKIMLLVPAAVGSNWYRDYVDGHAHVLVLNGRLCFDGKGPYPKDCILCLYGLGIQGGFEVWTWGEKS